MATWISSTLSNQERPWAARRQLRPGAKPDPTATGTPARPAAPARASTAIVSASPSPTSTAGRPAWIVASTASNWVPRGVAMTTASASMAAGKGWCSRTTRSPSERPTRARRSADVSRSTIESTVSVASSWRATRAPTAPAPRTATLISATSGPRGPSIRPIGGRCPRLHGGGVRQRRLRTPRLLRGLV